MSGQRAKLKFQNCSPKKLFYWILVVLHVLTPIFSGNLALLLKQCWIFFFVKRVMVLNRYQICVKVIESSKGPSTILETQLSLACYQISRGLKEPCSIKYLKYADHLSPWKTLSFELGIANICYSESFYYKGSHKKSFRVKNCFTVYD